MNAHCSLIDIQIESANPDIPHPHKLIAWARAALETTKADIAIRVLDAEDSTVLNATYRNKSGPTNVLSFPLGTTPEGVLQGDIALCATLVDQEARAQNKPTQHHWAHLVIHGILHLQGYDHIEDEDAHVMEEREIAILSSLGIPNPYE